MLPRDQFSLKSAIWHKKVNEPNPRENTRKEILPLISWTDSTASSCIYSDCKDRLEQSGAKSVKLLYYCVAGRQHKLVWGWSVRATALRTHLTLLEAAGQTETCTSFQEKTNKVVSVELGQQAPRALIPPTPSCYCHHHLLPSLTSIFDSEKMERQGRLWRKHQ